MSTTSASDVGNREITAAVVRQKGTFTLESASLAPPREDEVLIKVVAAGLCHTDLVVRDQVYPVPLPIVLGHEGAGIVEAVGASVQKVAPGDHVAVSFLNCTHCRPCLDGSPASCANFNDMNFAGRRPDGSHALATPDRCGRGRAERRDGRPRRWRHHDRRGRRGPLATRDGLGARCDPRRERLRSRRGRGDPQNHRIRGRLSVPDVVVPQLIELHMQGRFPFDRLVTFYDFDQIEQAAADAESGATIKPILRIA